MHWSCLDPTHVARVAELDSLEHLPHDLLDGVLLRPAGTALQVVQRSVVHKLKHQVEPPLAPKHLYQVDQVLVA